MSTHFLLSSPFPAATATRSSSSSSSSCSYLRHHHHHHLPPLLLPGLFSYSGKDKQLASSFICSALSKPRTSDYSNVFQNGTLPLIKWREIEDVDGNEEKVLDKVPLPNQIKDRVDKIKTMLASMEDGEINVSPYDTAWVALVENIHQSGTPQFPSSLRWIADNQLPDGSWGDNDVFLAHDRLINTLACVIALKSWDLNPDKCEKGLLFVKENISKLENENEEHMPIGFEIAFPSLIEMAKKIGIEVPEDSPALQDIYVKRNLKLTRIPKDIMHNVPTTLLHSIEGMHGLDWPKLLKLQCQDGSFLFSPSSTAFALMETKDQNCFNYLNNMVHKFNGGFPNVYPVDLFEHIWVVDRLQRLGISRFFQPEIKECLSYVHRYWTEKGICWARNSPVQDIDDTAMGFRLLRLHGYDVSADVFKQFKKGDEFVCFVGQSNQAVTGIYNLYRASQLIFPGEKIIEEAKHFAGKFLRKKQAANQLLDKWIITKDLPAEVGFALDVPWYACLPRIEARFFIEQYGGENDVWIGKSLYRMSYVNNNSYLELAKQDYNNCQALHLMEWDSIQKWYEVCKLGDFGVSSRDLLTAYFVAAASIFESEASIQRLAWVKTKILLEAITSCFNKIDKSKETRFTFVDEFQQRSSRKAYVNGRTTNSGNNTRALIQTLLSTLSHFAMDALVVHGQDITQYLHFSWNKLLLNWQGGDTMQGEAELLVKTIHLMSGIGVCEELSSTHQSPQYQQLFDLTNEVCHQLSRYQTDKQNVEYNDANARLIEIDGEMSNLVKLVIDKSDDINTNIKQTFLTVTKSFYYTATTDADIVDHHIDKVLFERVV